MSENAAKARKSTQVSTTVSPEVFEALREHRFDKRIEKMTDIVSAAINDYMVKHNITPKTPATEDAAADASVAGKPTPKA